MCGFAGIYSENQKNIHSEILIKMSKKLLHRGPDDSGVWMNSSNSVGFSHQRLAVIDLTSSGHQPMQSSNKRYTIVFNGEIYNHDELRKQLDFNKWSGYSDTETLLECIESWGLDRTLKKINGMFAFALWDNTECTIHLVRDRMGEKPLYYGWQGDSFLFGSELKALKIHPSFQEQIHRDSLNLFFRYNHIPAPFSIYRNIFKLTPGTVLTLRQGEKKYKVRKYWSLLNTAIQGLSNLSKNTEKELTFELDNLLRKSVKQKMLSDVPIGAFLSAGIDSSIVVSIMQSMSSQPIKTFTIGFEDNAYDEAKDARLIAKHLGTDHHELYVKPQDIIDILPLLPELYDEPFSDASQIPTYLVSKLAKERVTVSLSGDGGDELFCGYNRYHFTQKFWGVVTIFPFFFRKMISFLLLSIPVNFWNKLENFAFLSKKYNNIGLKLNKVARAIVSNTLYELYDNLLSNWKINDQLVQGAKNRILLDSNSSKDLDRFSKVEKMMLWDMQSYLPNDILVKLDRASMGVSLEGRVPFLDHKIVEFAWRVPSKYKYKNNKGKWLLRQVLHQYIPKELTDRPKSGFTLPLSGWLRGPLKEWAEGLINNDRLVYEGILNSDIVSKRWQEHQTGEKDWSSQLWSILMFQLWLEHNTK
jgi:asparagine synthase (glutamine-hydrolysing)